jgi:hypothetical protein
MKECRIMGFTRLEDPFGNRITVRLLDDQKYGVYAELIEKDRGYIVLNKNQLMLLISVLQDIMQNTISVPVI